MASAGFVHPGTGSHTERLHTQGNVSASDYKTTQPKFTWFYLSFFFALPDITTSLHWGGKWKEDQYQKRQGKLREKRS